MRRLPRLFSWLVMGLGVPLGLAAERCSSITGAYDAGEGTIAYLEADGENVTGRYSGESRGTTTITGRVFGECLGEFMLNGTQMLLRIDRDRLVWSDGEVWRRHKLQTAVIDVGPAMTDSEGDEEPESPHRVATTVAVMLFGMLFMTVGVLYLINYPDPDIRKYAYGMISATMSVYTAVLLNGAVTTFLFKQLLHSPHPRGLGLPLTEELQCGVGFVYFFLGWMLLSLLSWRIRVDARQLQGFTSVGAHLLGFAGIGTARALMLSGPEGESGSAGQSALTVSAILTFMLAAKKIAQALRGALGRWQGSDNNHIDKSAERAIGEAENETIAQVTSFLVVLMVCQAVLGHVPLVQEAEEGVQWWHAKALVFGALPFAGCSVLAHVLSKRFRSRRFVRSILQIVANTLAMCVSWSLLWGSLYVMQLVFALSDKVDAELVRVINAFVVSAACVAFIFVGDWLADLFEGSASDAGQVARLQVQPIPQGDSVAMAPENSARFRILPDDQDVSMGLRIILHSLGLLMALSWDKAFETAEETVVEYLSETCHFKHEVIMKVLMAAMLAGFLMPAWMKYIVPVTMKQHKEHIAEIEISHSRQAQWQRGERGHKHHDGSEHSDEAEL